MTYDNMSVIDFPQGKLEVNSYLIDKVNRLDLLMIIWIGHTQQELRPSRDALTVNTQRLSKKSAAVLK